MKKIVGKRKKLLKETMVGIDNVCVFVVMLLVGGGKGHDVVLGWVGLD